jgi:hypothetical protein
VKILKSILTTVLILSITTLFAQDAKPTKEETGDYIESFLRDNRKVNLFCNGADYKSRSGWLSVPYDSLFSSYIQQYKYTEHRNDEDKEFKIALKNVEEIKIVTATGFQGGCIQVGLWFVEKGKSAFPIMHLPLWNGSFGSFNEQEYKNTQIYKAFNHLRKLCGAPEPIKFD